MKKLTLFALLIFLCGALLPRQGQAQGNTSLPFTINNNSTTSDTDLWVAIVGKNSNNDFVWVNPTNSQVLPMSPSYNTVTGPTINGNTGPGGNSKYAACFFRLSSIPNRTFRLPFIAGCRVYISRGQQLYLYFFGTNGAPSGYAGPNLQNPVDPNQGIVQENIELTNNEYGFFGNTTRVDAFNYPMGLELTGNGYYKKTGELLSAADIVSRYKASVPTEFQGTVNNSTGVITFPSKTAAFGDGTNGTPSGAYGQYFKSYIDAIWNKYKNTDLIFNAGNAGVFKGRINANDRLTLVGQSGAWAGHTGIINGRPTTQMAFEGKGLLDNRVGDGDCDLVVQAQITAAINRHVIDVTTATPGQQNFYDASKYYQAAPANYYARFWHLPGVSVDNLSYGFAYDDVNDQSASLHTGLPTKVVATWGGFAGQSNPPTTSGVATFYTDCNYAGTAVSLPVGDYTLAALQSRGIANDALSSLKVTSGYEVQIFNDDNFTGTSTTVRSNVSCYDANFNDKTSSMKLRASTAASFSRQLEVEANSVNKGMIVETCSEGGQDMGNIDQGDYLVWNGVTIPTTGSYLIEYRVASGASGGTISSDLNGGTTQLGNTAIPGTGGWQTWRTVSKTVTLNAGTYNFGVYAQTGGYNLNWVRISQNGAQAAARQATTASPATDTKLSSLRTTDLYPNPVRDQLRLNTEASLAGSQYRISNAYGAPIASGALNENAVSVSNLPAGIYTLTITTKDHQTITRRFVK